MCPSPRLVAPSHWAGHMPFAFWLVNAARPRMLVELGSYYGASFCAFCQEIDRLDLPCEAYAVDLWQGDAHMGSYDDGVYAELAAHVGKYYRSFAQLCRMSFDDALAHFLPGSIDILHLDGGHTHEAILHDFESWLPKMSPRGIVLIHDIRARVAGFGGVSAWEEISSRFPSLAFPHACGLGAVAVGADIPENVKAVLQSPPEQKQAFARVFQAQGRIYEDYFALESLRREDALKAGLREADLRKELTRMEAQCRAAHAAHAEDARRYEDRLREAASREMAYETSFSWKVTKPLRKLLRFCGF